jgi:tetratricopeptide (TPR) repeat protein
MSGHKIGGSERMTWNCLIVDLDSPNRQDTWQAEVQGQDFGCELMYVTSPVEAQACLGTGSVLTMALFAQESTPDVQALLKGFQTHVGCLADFQIIICDEPDPKFIASVFEKGIEQFISVKDWGYQLAQITKRAIELVSDPTTPESKTMSLMKAIRSADQQTIQSTAQELKEIAEYDYRAAFAQGKAAEASGDFDLAIDAYKNASAMNKLFRPSTSSLGESLLVSGRIDEALEIFKKLEKTNPYDVDRKANIAAAYIEKGDFENAQKYVDAANGLAPSSSRVLEVKAQVLLCTGKINDAFKLLDDMSEVGPFFAAKLNELGIQLSQAGKGKSALALYQKAHKIVRSELKYKISLNAALACRRLKSWDMALKYLARCQKEYGAPFPKLEKLREAILKAKQEEKTTNAPQGEHDQNFDKVS